MPWLLVREHLAKEWGLPPWEIDGDDLADEVGRWIEVENLKARWT